MIDIEQARQILDLGGGAIRYWASDITVQRDRGGDVESLSFKDGTRTGITLTPETFGDELPSGIEIAEIDEDTADQLIQLAVFGEVRHTEVALSEDEREDLDQSMRKMRVEDE